jgi:pimeloyl-ACP methyl ester carboxylesterase
MKKITNFLLAKTLGIYINFLSFVYPKKAMKLAYRFFSEPRDGKLKTQLIPNILKGASQEFLTFDVHRFSVYVWKGNETKILLVHGWESNSARWETFFPYLLKSGSTIIALDGPAHGLSNGKEFSVPIYAQFLNVVVQKFNPNYLIGHSIGG